jgi:hypothetical protein
MENPELVEKWITAARQWNSLKRGDANWAEIFKNMVDAQNSLILWLLSHHDPSTAVLCKMRLSGDP